MLNGADVSGRHFICVGIIQDFVSTVLLANPPVQGGRAWESGLHLLFAVDNTGMFALDPCRINQIVLTAQHKGLFSLFFTWNIILLFYW